MKTKTFIPLIFLTIFLFLIVTSCQKDSVNPRYDRLLVGTWKFQKVKLFPRYDLGPKDITDQYNGVTLELKDDKTVAWTQFGTTQTGNWSLRSVTTSNGDNTSACYLLDVNLGSTNSFAGTNLSVTKRKIRFSEEKGNGTYNYVLTEN